MSRPVDVVFAALEARDCRPRGTPERQVEALCPAHEDRNPSLGVKEGDDGRVLLKCQAGCATAEVVAALGLDWGDLFPAADEDRPVIADTYDYVDESGDLLYQVVRMVPKTFRQRRPDGNGGWEWRLGDTRRVLYRLPEVLEAKTRNDWVFVTEGEKDADAVRRAGHTATTLPGGAGKWKREYTEALIGALVIVVADDDEPGRLHAAEVARQLHGFASRVAVRLPAAPHKDIADHLRAGLTLKDLRRQQVLEDLPASPNGHFVKMTSAAFCSRPQPSRERRLVGPGIVRDQRITIGAQTGEGKTTMGFQIIQSLVTGEPFLDPTWRPTRVGRALIVDVEQGEETIKQRFREAGLDSTGAVDLVWQPSGFAFDKKPEDVQAIEDVLKDGNYDIALFDPLYQLHQGDQNSERTAADVMRILDDWARRYHMAVLIPMHARKPHPQAGWKQFSMNDIGGNGAWVRNAEVVFGLQLAWAGFSRMWFFKDRDGQLPPIRTWWALDFDRAHGFRHNMEAEDTHKHPTWERLKQLLLAAGQEGRPLADLVDSLDVTESTVKSSLRKVGAHENETGLWRLDPWPDLQQAFMTGGPLVGEEQGL